MKQLLVIAILMILITACGTSSVDPRRIDRGEGFFPVRVGQYFEYGVEETHYLISGEIETLRYELREEVADTFLSGGDTAFVVFRYTRAGEETEWTPLNTWQIYKNDHHVAVSEENIPFIKLSFPVKAGQFWDGNALNGLEEDRYTADSLYFGVTINGVPFDSTLTVIQNDNQDLIVEQDRRIEVYKHNTGLVYREQLLLRYCSDPDCLGQQQIETGHEYYQLLLRHGKN